MIVRPLCAVCGEGDYYIEVIPPGEMPADFGEWEIESRDWFLENRDPEEWWMRCETVGGGNGDGDGISEEEARALLEAFREPLTTPRGMVVITRCCVPAWICALVSLSR